MRTAEPISAATVQTAVDYMLTAGPLPPHILSRPLLQRHHFLGLAPEDGADYLAWPSADQSRAVALLQAAVPQLEPPIAVQYSADPENLVAHVRITPDLRLLFLFDPTSDSPWLYHNVALMPFPDGSHSSFQSAYAIYSPDDFLPEPQYSLTVQGDDDAYWDSYGGPDDDHSRNLPHKDVPDPNLNAEDAYWAQYSAVQGSGDSTIPSPRIKDKRLDGDVSTDPIAQDRIIIPSDSLQRARDNVYNPLQPPEPGALASRLAVLAMQPRSGAASPPLIDDSPTSDTESNPLSARDVDTASAPASSIGSATSQRQSAEYLIVDRATDLHDPAQDALRDHVKSLYRLWSSTVSDKSADEQKAVFLAAVQQALSQL